MKVCSKCKVSKNESEFYKRLRAKDGLRPQCKECERRANAIREPLYKETRRKWLEENPEKRSDFEREYYKTNKGRILTNGKFWRQTFKGRLASYKKAAKDRSIEWNLSDDQFKSFWQKSCSYCGSEIKTIGLDRVDSEKGYQLDNIISCCSHCNLMKMKQSYTSFIERIKLIHKNLNL